MTDSRLLPVPDGLDGERVDVALARMFGLSRTAAAAIVDEGAVTLDGAAPSRSTKVRAGAWMDVILPPPPVVPTSRRWTTPWRSAAPDVAIW
jgi:23S rRNA pseudouridine1911/1915/1917 synthase